MGIGPVPAVRKLLARAGLDRRRHRPRRAERGVRIAGARRRPRARGRREARERERRRDRDRASARHERRAARRDAAARAAEPGGRYGVATMCVGVGQGQAALFERGDVQPHAGGDRGRRPRRPHARPPAPPRRGRFRDPGEPQPRVRRRAGAGRRPRARRVELLRPGRCRRAACAARVSSRRDRAAVGASPHRIAFDELTGGKSIVVYGQTEVVKDLIEARLAERPAASFRRRATWRSTTSTPTGRGSAMPTTDAEQALECDVVAGCDGFHGVCRPSIPRGVLRELRARVPVRLARDPGPGGAVARRAGLRAHEGGFALLSMRSPELTRLYLQCAADEPLAGWPDERIWEELQARARCSTDGRSTRGRSSRRA